MNIVKQEPIENITTIVERILNTISKEEDENKVWFLFLKKIC